MTSGKIGMKRILIIGCGDIAMRVARLLRPHYQLFGLVRNPLHPDKLRATGIVPLMGNLDDPHSLDRLSGLAHIVLHFAPPPAAAGAIEDTRTRNLIAALSRGTLPQRLIYISTSGVYGDCNSEVVAETRPTHAQNARAKRRLDAENRIRNWAKRSNIQTTILRVPGIYAADRLPLERLHKGTPAIIAAEDGYTNHIHADDLARIIIAALRYAKPSRIYHTTDDYHMKMGDYFDAVADAFDLPHPLRVTRAEAQNVLTPVLLSFMNESRRLTNTRMKQELKVRLRYPTVADALAEIRPHDSAESAPPVCASPRQTQLPLLLF
jgi:nucleoside-diphosphate-sugar epimerase